MNEKNAKSKIIPVIKEKNGYRIQKIVSRSHNQERLKTVNHLHILLLLEMKKNLTCNSNRNNLLKSATLQEKHIPTYHFR